MAHEPTYAWSFIYATLAGDATLIGATALGSAKIYLGLAPQNAVYPFIVGNLQGDADFNNLNQQSRLISQQTWQLRVIGKIQGGVLQDGTRFKTAVNRMDELLRNKRRVAHTAPDATLYYFNSWREQTVFRDEEGETADIRYRNAGGMYTVQVFA